MLVRFIACIMKKHKRQVIYYLFLILNFLIKIKPVLTTINAIILKVNIFFKSLGFSSLFVSVMLS